MILYRVLKMSVGSFLYISSQTLRQYTKHKSASGKKKQNLIRSRVNLSVMSLISAPARHTPLGGALYT